VICISDEAEATARDEVLLAVAADPTTPPIEPPAPNLGSGIQDGAVDAAVDASVAGLLFPQATVFVDGRRGLLEDIIDGGSFVLYALDADPEALLDADTADYLRELGTSFVEVDQSLDPENLYREWFEAHGCKTALVRPDFYVFGRAVTGAATCEVARRLRAALNNQTTSEEKLQ
jgi:resorcinol 4-hydroxylase (NADPH)